jgi:hypothetical protein
VISEIAYIWHHDCSTFSMHRTAIVSRLDFTDTRELPIVDEKLLSTKAFHFRVVAGPNLGKVTTLDHSSPPYVVVGNGAACTIRLTDPHVSRKHIALTATSTHVMLLDLGSTNGTRVNGVVVNSVRLHGGETISIGQTVLGVEVDELEPANRPPTLPPPPEEFFTSLMAEGLTFGQCRERVIEEFERRYVQSMLERHHGNITHAARASGVTHRYFQLVRARTLTKRNAEQL